MRPLFDPIRRPLSLNGEWLLWEDREENGLYFRSLEDGFRTVSVPSDMAHCIPERPDVNGVFWFKRCFSAEKSAERKRAVLRFEGVNHSAHVFVNGRFVGENRQGYLPFELDITDALLPEGENDLTVRVDTRRRQGQLPTSFYWKNCGGIIRDVWLYFTDSSYIEDASVEAHCGGEAVFKVRGTFGDGAWLDISLKDSLGRVLLEKEEPLCSGEHITETCLSGVSPWSPEDPALYSAELTLKKNGSPVDRTAVVYGYRDFCARDGKLWLNGKEIFLKGFNRHEDHPSCGGAANREVIERDLAMIKASGANFIRMCHYPHDRYELDTADRLGLCLLVEIPLCAYLGPTFGLENPETAPQNELVYANACECLRRMIARDRNHPGVVIWSVSNENNEPADPCVLDNHKGLLELAKMLDPTRPVTHVSTYSTHEDRARFFEHDDIVCFNAYPVQNTRVDRGDRDCSFERSAEMIPRTVRELRELFPGKPVLVTEFGYRTGVPFDSVDSERLQAEAVASEFLAACREANGASVWVFADHLWPNDPELLSDISRFGLLWPDRSKKAAFDVYSQLLKNTP